MQPCSDNLRPDEHAINQDMNLKIPVDIISVDTNSNTKIKFSTWAIKFIRIIHAMRIAITALVATINAVEFIVLPHA